MQIKIVILGGGLTGLTLAYYLQKENIPFLLLEARDRIGGRIKTIYGENEKSIEMGATWFGKKHTYLTQLLAELNIGYFPQHTSGISLFETFSFAPPQKFTIPETEEEQSYRISGGSGSLTNALLKRINSEFIHLDKPVNFISFQNGKVEIKTKTGVSFFCEKVISTLPPRLLATTIQFEPDLPASIKNICQETHTWMGESIKFSLEYPTDFWRKNGYSGAAFSQAGICSEMHDHCSEDGRFFALKGFLNPGAARLPQAERKDLLLTQLTKYFGEIVRQYSAWHEAIWSDEQYTFTPYDGFVRAHQNNGHESFKAYYQNGALRIAGSETATHFPGYMDGAVCSAMEVLQELKK